MAIYDNRHDYDALMKEIAELKENNRKLNIDLMKSQARFSDADETLRRWRVELEIVASKSGHNLCHIWIPLLLKNTLGHTGNFPDPENCTPEEFAQGCVVYHRDIFPDCGIKLVVIPKDLGNKGMLTPEQSDKAKDISGFKK